MDEKNKNDFSSKSSASDGIPQELLNFKKICHSRCSICSSGILKEVHDWRKRGLNYDEIVERAKSDHNTELSASSLCRHFKSYKAFKMEMATQIIKNDVVEEITTQAVHIKKTVELLDIAYEKLLKMFKSNLYKITVGDLEKLTNMRYKILNGENLDNNDLMAIFQKATDDYGLNLQQGVLFK